MKEWQTKFIVRDTVRNACYYTPHVLLEHTRTVFRQTANTILILSLHPSHCSTSYEYSYRITRQEDE